MNRTFGFELEYASRTDRMAARLHDEGRMGTDEVHAYHCDCEECSFAPFTRYREDGSEAVEPNDLRAQRDSTADGEFITRILDNFDDLVDIAGALTSVATQVGATTNERCGLHVHVAVDNRQWDGSDQANFLTNRVPLTYLAFERYFSEIVAPGNASRKRDMNSTLMEALRGYIADGYRADDIGTGNWTDIGRAQAENLVRKAILRDRHVDLNWSRKYRTWEFRCFNATNAPWRIELACRMSVAFVEATQDLSDEIEGVVHSSPEWTKRCDSAWGEIIRPAWSEKPNPHLTKKPLVPLDRFVDILCAHDPELRPLIQRQANYMRRTYAKTVLADPIAVGSV